MIFEVCTIPTVRGYVNANSHIILRSVLQHPPMLIDPGYTTVAQPMAYVLVIFMIFKECIIATVYGNVNTTHSTILKFIYHHPTILVEQLYGRDRACNDLNQWPARSQC